MSEPAAAASFEKKVMLAVYGLHLLLGSLYFLFVFLQSALSPWLQVLYFFLKLLPTVTAATMFGLAAYRLKEGKVKAALGRVLWLLGAVFLSAFLSSFLSNIDRLHALYEWYYILALSLYESLIQCLWQGGFYLLLLLCLGIAAARQAKLKTMNLWIGAACFILLCAGEIRDTIGFFVEFYPIVYAGEVLYILMTYLLYAAYGVAAYCLAGYAERRLAL
ncbi:MAG: hypothetical protein WDA00_06695 [Eubacteriales bacterium]